MTPETIPVEIRRFIARHVHSIAEMEVLVMMVSEPDGEWDAASVAKKLYIAPAEAQAVLKRLVDNALAERRGDCYRSGLGSSPDAAIAEALVALYSVQLIPVTNLIHAQRKSRIQEFADAFHLRKGN